MLPRSQWRCLQSCSNAISPDASLSRAFFAAAPPASRTKRTFCQSRRCESKIGRAAIAVPPGVEFNVLAPNVDRKVGLAEKPPMSKVHVKGPLGS
jgi:hypothetical protein